ncbi:MAG: hypothetical protein ABDI07_00845 [Candidatus Kryptonium sp.]
MEIKPEKNEASTPNDTTLITVNEPKKIFTDQIIEHTIDSVIIPKRTKQEKTPQIIVTPIILPIATYPVQIQEQKPEPKVELKPEVKKQGQIQVIPESKEEIKTTLTALQPEVKETKTESDITTPKPQPITQKPQFSIQIGAFITKNSAKEHLDKFTRLYPDKNAYIVYDSTLGFYKVHIDGVSDSTLLLQTLEIIKENFPDAFITSQNTATLIQQVSDEQHLNYTNSFLSAYPKSELKVQVGVYSKISHAEKIKEYIRSKFKVKSEIVKTNDVFKVLIFLDQDDINTFNEIKSEFADAFIIK